MGSGFCGLRELWGCHGRGPPRMRLAYPGGRSHKFSGLGSDTWSTFFHKQVDAVVTHYESNAIVTRHAVDLARLTELLGVRGVRPFRWADFLNCIKIRSVLYLGNLRRVDTYQHVRQISLIVRHESLVGPVPCQISVVSEVNDTRYERVEDCPRLVYIRRSTERGRSGVR